MGDDELAQIRARRMAQLQAAQGGGTNAGGMGAGPEGDPEAQAKKAEEQRAAVEDMKNNILTQVLSQEARARLNTLRVAKPEKGAQIESALIRMAQSGQLGGKLSEEELIGLLERFSESTAAPKTTVKFDRRRAALDSDDSD